MAVKSVVDIGTNSIKLLVMSSEADSHRGRVLADGTKVVRLGSGLKKEGTISADAASRAFCALDSFVAEARALGSDEIFAVGTEALRIASNAEAFLDEIERRCGFRVFVIGGKEEAELSFLAARAAVPSDGDAVVFDVGGGSSEIVVGDASGATGRLSLPVGALTLHDEFFESFGEAVPGSALASSCARVKALFAKHLTPGFFSRDGCLAIGVGGTITTLAAVKLSLVPYDPQRITGCTLTTKEIDEQILRYASTGARGRLEIEGLAPDRADIILAGACITRTLMEASGASVLTVSDRGLRYGAMERFCGLVP